MNKTLIAAFSVVVIPLGLVVGASAADPEDDSHTVSYTVAPLRAISVELRAGEGSADIDFGTISRNEVKTNILTRLKVTAEDAAGENSVKVRVAMNADPGEGIELTVSAGTMTNGDGGAVSPDFPETEGLNVSTQDLITLISRSGGVLNAPSNLTYTLTTTNAVANNTEVAHTVTYTLLDGSAS